MEKEHNFGIDLLKILLTFFICILHVLSQSKSLRAPEGTIEHNFFWLLEIICFCAVDGYALISGYISQSKMNNYKRIILIVMETFFYSFIFTYILRQFNLGQPLNRQEAIEAAFPILFNKFWYVTSYFPLFFVMPLINHAVDSIDEKQAKHFLIVMFVLFPFVSAFKDNFWLGQGYSFPWLLILYTIGSLMRKADFLGKLKSSILFIIYLLCVIITWVCLCFFYNYVFVNYISPTIVLCAMCLVVIFSRIKINSKFVPKVSSLCLGIFLCHYNPIVYNYILPDLFSFIPNLDLFVAFLAVIGGALAVFIVCGIIDYIRSLLFKLLRLDKIAEFLHNLINKILDKISAYI